jgi:tetratricopeptide (TPR) repeat protein
LLVFLASRRSPAIYCLLLAALMCVAYRNSGSVSPPLPQAVANEAFRRVWAGKLSSPDGAIPLFHAAVVSDPAFPWRWSDLGDALTAAGRDDQASYCFRESLALGPASPQIALRAANFYFATGRIEPALALGATILRELPDYDDMVFSSYVRMGGGLDGVLDTGIGNNPRAARTFFQFLLRGGGEERLSRAWRWIDGRGYTTRPLARSWANWLLQRGRAGEAAAVWMQHGAGDAGVYRISNWVDNAGFEDQWTGGAFDWVVDPSPGVKTVWDAQVVHSGRHSLRLDLDAVDNLDFHHVSQRVWLDPGRYRLSGWVRTMGFTTDQGVGLRLTGAGNAADPDVSTPAIAGSREWTQLSAEFTLRAPARLARVEIVRHPSEKFDNRPHGTAWIDDVAIQRLN